MVNRGAIIIKPKEPFYKWLESIPDPMTLSPEHFDEDSIAYLIPSWECDEELEDTLSKMYDILFEEVLSGWWTVEEDWPINRTLKMFKEWFDFSAHSLLIDLVDAPLHDDD